MLPPLITIGMACFNAEKTIARALDCALAQDYPNTEIIVVDDGSSDDSIRIVEQYATKHSNIRYIKHEKNMGFASALNTMLDRFKGDYIAFFDDDDVSVPDRLSKQYTRLTNFHSNFALCWGHLRLVSPEGTPLHTTWLGIGRNKKEPCCEKATHYFLTGKADSKYSWGITGTCALMGHRETFKRIGKYDPTMLRAEDLEFAIRASIKDCHFISVDQVLLDYCYRGESLKNEFTRWRTHCRIAQKYQHIVPVHQMKFFQGDECKYLCRILKKERNMRSYIHGVWTIAKISPVAGAKFFFRPKNILRMLRMPFINLHELIFSKS